MQTDTFLIFALSALVIIVQAARIEEAWGNWRKVSWHLLMAVILVSAVAFAFKD